MPRKKKEEEEHEVELNADVALAQAANVLITAAERAEHNNDVPALMKIAGGWMEIHEYLTGTHTQEDKKSPLGFTNAHVETEEVEELDDAIAEPAEARSKRRGSTSNSVRGVYPKHGKLRITEGRHWRI